MVRLMSSRVMVCVAATALLLAGCSSSSQKSAQSWRAEATFTCCSGQGLHRVYHPGDVVVLHWIKRSTSSAAPATPVASTLTARLDGAFATVTRAKAARAQAPERVGTRPVRVTDRTPAAPTSRLRIPVSAAPGWYDLTTRVASQGSVIASTSVVRVAARH